MHRGLVHVCAWSLATGAAVTLSWWGVHTVMAGTAYDPPRAVPLTGDGHSAQGAVFPLPSSTQRPRQTPSPSDSPSAKPSKSPGSHSPTPANSPSPYGPSGSSTSSGSSGNVKGYNVAGGRVVFDIGSTSAQLVAATPDTGWQMQVWRQPTWIRVTFSKGGREVSVFCTWYNHAPTVEFDDRG
ncbi:hypothetical protein [Streptomyces sp. CBMA152]|uniref:hypothetical protein n=1 Tax=Streptomyces sp. CBMA152 TaxID=1896312 RepID=UPI001660F94A|nr:hypothetical protein [Streptomyces sp. CBMA152]